jgi:hypothetical protein
MDWASMKSRKAPWSLGVGLLACSVLPTTTLGQERPIGEKGPAVTASADRLHPPLTQLAEWIEGLDSDSYAARQLAYQLLQPHPAAALPLVEAAVDKADEDAAQRLIRLLAGWSSNPNEGYGKIAFATLERLAGGVSARAQFAQGTIQAIAEEQSERAADFLSRLSAFVGYDSITLFALQRADSSYYLLRLDDAFRGDAADLECLRWLNYVELVRLDGQRIDGSWLEKVIRLPNLRILQLRHTSITAADLELLHRAEQLEGLEIMYTPIDDEAIETLATLPLAGRIRLFGTRISEAGVEKLRGQLEGSEINFGRGGFLGISSQSMSLVLTMVNPGSAADKAGLRVNDRILKIQGIELKTFEELRNELAKYAPGEEVTLTFERRGSGLELPDGEPSNFQAEVRVILGEQN